MTGKWGDPTGNPEDDWPDDETHVPPEVTKVWSKFWVRAVLFVVLLTPAVVLAIVGPVSWLIVLAAGVGLLMLLFNNAMYASDALSRGSWFKNGEDIEQSDFSKAYSMGCAGFIWLIAIGLGLLFIAKHK